MTNEDLMLDVGLANELKLALRRGGFDNAGVKWLIESKILADVHEVRLGYMDIKPSEHVMDLDAEPGIHGTVVRNILLGQWKWNPDEIHLYMPPEQVAAQERKRAEGSEFKHFGSDGHTVLKAVYLEHVLNDRAWEYLRKHPRLIPEDWRGKTIVFWGTIFAKCDSGKETVPYMWCRDSGEWVFTHAFLDDFTFNDNAFCPLLKAV